MLSGGENGYCRQKNKYLKDLNFHLWFFLKSCLRELWGIFYFVEDKWVLAVTADMMAGIRSITLASDPLTCRNSQSLGFSAQRSAEYKTTSTSHKCLLLFATGRLAHLHLSAAGAATLQLACCVVVRQKLTVGKDSFWQGLEFCMCEKNCKKKKRHPILQTWGSGHGAVNASRLLWTCPTAVAFSLRDWNNVDASLLFWLLDRLFCEPAQLGFDSAEDVTPVSPSVPAHLLTDPHWIPLRCGAARLFCTCFPSPLSNLAPSHSHPSHHDWWFIPELEGIFRHIHPNLVVPSKKKDAVSEWICWSWDPI